MDPMPLDPHILGSEKKESQKLNRMLESIPTDNLKFTKTKDGHAMMFDLYQGESRLFKASESCSFFQCMFSNHSKDEE